jgi:two-component system, OmpR family, sensor kinase
VPSLLRRRLNVPLRLKVMAGVVVVTLAALAAFDVGVVITTRRYLLTQTDNNLHQALTVIEPRLHSLLSERVPGPPSPPPPPAGSPGGTVAEPLPGFPDFLGDFEIVFLPRRGPVPVVILEVAATNGTNTDIGIQSDLTGYLAGPGAHTVMVDGVLFRILSARFTGGSLIAGTSLSQVTGTTGQVEAIVTFGSVAVVLLTGLGVFAVVRRGLRPIEAMARQADAITGGDLAGRVATHDPRSEVGRLGAALNGMLARIEASQQQMRRFFADASHELRTPLASLRANAQLFQQGAVQDPGEVGEVMDRIVMETRRMGRLVDDMLGLARLGQLRGRCREPVDLTAVVTGCAQRVRVAGPARAWQVQIARGLMVTGDQELLRRAIDNLLMNVLVHTPAGAAGAITASAAGDSVTIEVSDDGPGVAPGHLPHIFERFYRAAPRSGGSGSGLGLAIAAETASAHGGTAQAAPVSPHGLRITLTLPARPDPRSPPELAASPAELSGPTSNAPCASTASQLPDQPRSGRPG